MTYFKDMTITPSEGMLDAFSRMRVSQAMTIFDYSARYGLQALQWESVVSGDATAVQVAAQSAIRLRTTTNVADAVYRQTYQYHHYQPGKSQLILCTFVMGAGAASVIKRVGYYDNSNGIFLKQNGASGMQLVRRTDVGGSPSDTDTVEQADWNLDAMDGDGPSGLTLDWEKAQILVIDLQWLGVGRVRVGFVVGGVLYYVHQFLHSNVLSTVYMGTGSLPVRYEIQNSGAPVSSTNDFYQICAAVMSEGGMETERALTFAASNGTTAIGVTTRQPILSLRPVTTFGGQTNRTQIMLDEMAVHCTTNGALLELVYNGTLTGASFADVDGTYSSMQKDVAATAISGGTVVWQGYIAAGATVRSSIAAALSTRVPICLAYDGSTRRGISVVATSLTGTSNLAAALNWRELQ